MRGYTVIFDYGPLGGEKKTFTLWVKAYNKQEALLRAGARFHNDTNLSAPAIITNISVTGRSLHGWG